MKTIERFMDYGNPIEEYSYIDEDDIHVTEKIYFKSDAGREDVIPFLGSGSGWFRKEKVLTWDDGFSRATNYYAEGHFVWGNGDASVSNAKGGWDYIPSETAAFDVGTTSGTGRYGGIFNKYAYVTFSFTVTNVIGLDSDCSVTIRVSESGNSI